MKFNNVYLSFIIKYDLMPLAKALEIIVYYLLEQNSREKKNKTIGIILFVQNENVSMKIGNV